MSKRNYDRKAPSSFCPRTSALNAQDYREGMVERLGKAMYYAKKRRRDKIDRLKTIRSVCKNADADIV